MQVTLPPDLHDTDDGRDAERILRTCVHCGFCNATCPTYQLLGDERDGPRGRIYQIKEMLEHGRASEEARLHLDRCLTCRACETTCPSGVEYHRLLEIGRAFVERHLPRPFAERLQRDALLAVVPQPERFGPLLALARAARPLLPASIKASLPTKPAAAEHWPARDHPRRVLLLEGCVQSVTHPRINAATARVLDRLGVRALPAAGCCGALSHHLSREARMRDTLRRNIDAWWPEVEAGAEAVLLTASGCAPTVRDYGRLLRNDPAYAERAARLAALAMDISEFIEGEDLSALDPLPATERPIAFQAPCSLQHGLQRAGRVESLLTGLGFKLTPVADAHLCCGSAGSYAVLQRELSERLLANKIRNLEAGDPALIATANIGCLMHLEKATERPVRHWIELLDV
ncbi:MAG: glycolate oxidase subunit GlcF [Xanthomonadales bacterium]